MAAPPARGEPVGAGEPGVLAEPGPPEVVGAVVIGPAPVGVGCVVVVPPALTVIVPFISEGCTKQ